MPSYFDSPLSYTDADAIAALLPAASLPAYNAASGPQKTLALELASEHVDRAHRYQGRKYEALGQTQILEFPRVAYENSRQGVHNRVGAYDINATWVEDTIWDWDSTNNIAIVPPAVLRAVVFEADSILSGSRNARLDAQHDGVASQGLGSANESYRDQGKDAPALCREADLQVRKYRLRQGGLL